MSFRPTIAVFIRGQIADYGYYRNWYEKDLFYEALTMALIYADCGTLEEYRQRRFGMQKIFYVVEPEEFENTEENMEFLLSCSEFPIAVDLTAGCIYVSEKPLSPEELEKLPLVFDLGEPADGRKPKCIDGSSDFYWLLKKHRIPFGELDRENTLRLLRDWDDVGCHLSEDTYRALMGDELREDGACA